MPDIFGRETPFSDNFSPLSNPLCLRASVVFSLKISLRLRVSAVDPKNQFPPNAIRQVNGIRN